MDEEYNKKGYEVLQKEPAHSRGKAL